MLNVCLLLPYGLFQALSLRQKEDIMELVDPRLGSAFKKKEAARMIKVALLAPIPTLPLFSTQASTQVCYTFIRGQNNIHSCGCFFFKVNLSFLVLTFKCEFSCFIYYMFFVNVYTCLIVICQRNL